MDILDEETRKLVDAVDEFAAEMKERIIQKSKEGYSGYSTCSNMSLIDAMNNRLYRLAQGENKVAIGIANFALIHWLNNKGK